MEDTFSEVFVVQFLLQSFDLLQTESELLECFSIIYCSQHADPPSKNNMFGTKNIYLVLKRPLDY